MSRSRHGVPPDDALVRTFGVTPPPGRLVPPQTPGWHHLLFATDGAVRVRTEAGSWVVPPHRALWLPAGTRHELDVMGTVEMRSLYLAVSSFRQAPRRACTVNVSPLLRALIVHAVARGALRRSCPADRRLAAVLRDQLEFVDTVPLQLPWPRDVRAQRVAELLRAQPATADALPILGRKVGASARTLERLFRAEVNMTFDAWRRRLRLVHAVERLAQGESVTTAALDAGYTSTSAFIATFRRELGTTPGRYV